MAEYVWPVVRGDSLDIDITYKAPNDNGVLEEVDIEDAVVEIGWRWMGEELLMSSNTLQVDTEDLLLTIDVGKITGVLLPSYTTQFPVGQNVGYQVRIYFPDGRARTILYGRMNVKPAAIED